MIVALSEDKAIRSEDVSRIEIGNQDERTGECSLRLYGTNLAITVAVDHAKAIEIIDGLGFYCNTTDGRLVLVGEKDKQK